MPAAGARPPGLDLIRAPSPRPWFRLGTGESARTRLTALTAVPLLLALVLAAALGAAVSSGQLLVAVLGVSVLLLVALRAQSSGSAPLQLSFWAVAVAVSLVTLNGLRVHPSVTAADVVLVLAAIVLAGGLLVAPRVLSVVPPWLVIAAGGLLLAALLAELFPPSHLSDYALGLSDNNSLFDGPGTDQPLPPTQEEAMARNMSFAIRLTGTMFLLPLIVGLVCTTWRRLSALVDVWLVGVALNAAAATLAGFSVLDLQETLVGRDYSIRTLEHVRFPGLAVHPNALSMSCALVLPVVLTRMSAGKRLRYGALFALLATAILFSGSRAGLVAAPLAIGLLLLLQRRTRVRNALLGVVAGGTIVAYGLASGVLSLTIDRLTGASGAMSDARRFSQYQETLNEVLGRPIVGHGFEVIRGTHNMALELLYAGGIIALAAFALFVVGMTRLGLDLGRDSRLPPEMRLLANALTASLWVWILMSLVANLVFDRFLFVPAGLLLGMYFARARMHGTEGNPSAIPRERSAALSRRRFEDGGAHAGEPG